MKGPRTLHELLRDVTRALGDADSTPEEIESLAIQIRRRASQTAKDLEAVAAGRRNGRHPSKGRVA
jgi:hypothetical protein